MGNSETIGPGKSANEVCVGFNCFDRPDRRCQQQAIRAIQGTNLVSDLPAAIRPPQPARCPEGPDCCRRQGVRTKYLPLGFLRWHILWCQYFSCILDSKPRPEPRRNALAGPGKIVQLSCLVRPRRDCQPHNSKPVHASKSNLRAHWLLARSFGSPVPIKSLATLSQTRSGRSQQRASHPQSQIPEGNAPFPAARFPRPCRAANCFRWNRVFDAYNTAF